jgi:hypothetical protein
MVRRRLLMLPFDAELGSIRSVQLLRQQRREVQGKEGFQQSEQARLVAGRQ